MEPAVRCVGILVISWSFQVVSPFRIAGCHNGLSLCLTHRTIRFSTKPKFAPMPCWKLEWASTPSASGSEFNSVQPETQPDTNKSGGQGCHFRYKHIATSTSPATLPEIAGIGWRYGLCFQYAGQPRDSLTSARPDLKTYQPAITPNFRKARADVTALQDTQGGCPAFEVTHAYPEPKGQAMVTPRENRSQTTGMGQQACRRPDGAEGRVPFLVSGGRRPSVYQSATLPEPGFSPDCHGPVPAGNLQ